MDKDNKANSFMDFFNDPSKAMKSTKFSVASATVQFIGLLFFAVVGASISFKFTTFRDLLDLNYWITIVVLLIEQLYAYNIGYDLGRAMMVNSNEELKRTNTQINALVEGVYDEQTQEELIRGIKKDSTIAQQAINELTREDKIELVKTRMNEIINIFASKLELFRSYEKERWFFPKKIVLGKGQRKYFWSKKRAMTYCERQIDYGKQMITDEEAIVSIPDLNVRDYTKLEYANLISTQDDIKGTNVSRYHQRSEIKERAKENGKRALKKIVMASIGGSIVFGAFGGDQALGMIVYTLFLLTIQVAGGVKSGGSNVSKILLYNAVNRLKALKDTQARISDIKQRKPAPEVKEVAKQEVMEVAKQECETMIQEQENFITAKTVMI